VAERTVKVERVQAVKYLDRDFAGMSTADDAVNLAFKIAGQVAGVDVSKGDYVKRGQTLARLDPRDVELQVAADRAQYERARSQFDRVSRLMEHEAVSRQEYESAQTALVQARSAFENTSDLLVETTLRAPFAGVIERTYVDTYQRVSAGQTILRLVNPVSTTVEFTMPERSLPILADSLTRFTVRFDNYPDISFRARLDTYAKTASDASGFPVSLKLSKAEILPYNISPGMTCQVTIRASESASNLVAIPLTAVYAPAQGGNYVWRVASDDRVELCAVSLGNVFGRDMVTVLSGLKPGDVVVTAGVYRLKEGEKVRIIK
jgi:RND family efflux transporter MFP subunit